MHENKMVKETITCGHAYSQNDELGLGSDFDGSVSAPFSAAEILVLTQALLNTKFTRPQIEKVMGGNVKRLFLDNLPANRYGHTVTLF